MPSRFRKPRCAASPTSWVAVSEQVQRRRSWHRLCRTAKKAGTRQARLIERKIATAATGPRPGKVKIGGKKDGTIVAYEVVCYGSPGVGSVQRESKRAALRLRHSQCAPQAYCDSLNHGGAWPCRRQVIHRTAFSPKEPLTNWPPSSGWIRWKFGRRTRPECGSFHQGPTRRRGTRSVARLISNSIALPGCPAEANGTRREMDLAPAREARHRHGDPHLGRAGGGPNDMFVTIASDGSVLVQSSPRIWVRPRERFWP